MRTSMRLLTIALLLSTSACSFMFVRPAPPRQAWSTVSWAPCTRSSFWPVIDTLMTVSSGLQLALPDLFVPADGQSSTLSTPQAASSLLLTLAWGASAYYGFSSRSRCRAFVYRQMRLRHGMPVTASGASPYGAGQPPEGPPPQPGQPDQPGAGPGPMGPGDAGVMEPPAAQPPAGQPPLRTPR